jgi:hypothetical protein
MKRDIWNELARRARLAKSEPTEMPFRFDDSVLNALKQSPAPAWNPLSVWLPVLRPAVGLAFVITLLCLFANYRTASTPTTDFVSETESLIQMAVLHE